MDSALVRIRGLINDLTRSLSGAIVHIDDLFMNVDNKSVSFDNICLTNEQLSRSLELFLKLRLDLIHFMDTDFVKEYTCLDTKHNLDDSIINKQKIIRGKNISKKM